MNRFVDWLTEHLQRLDWSQADLARAAGLTRGGVSNLVNRSRSPDAETLVAIARALKVPVEEAFRAAGYLPPKLPSDELKEKVAHLVAQMDDSEKTDVLEYAELVLRRRDQRDLVGDFVARYRMLSRDDAVEAQRRLFAELGLTRRGGD